MTKSEDCGLVLTKEDFKKLRDEEKLAIIYENLTELRESVAGYRFHTKVMYSTIGFIFGVIAFLCPYIFGK